MPKQPIYPTVASFTSAEADTADPNIEENPDLNTPHNSEFLISEEFREAAASLALHIELLMEEAGFAVSEGNTEDEFESVCIVNISGDSDTLSVGRKIEHPKAIIERRYRHTDNGDIQEITDLKFSTSSILHKPDDASLEMSSQWGWIKFRTREYSMFVQYNKPGDVYERCRAAIDKAMEKYFL